MTKKDKYKYKNTYCPFCTGKTDQYGDCWESCNYEAEMNGKVLEPKPLTEIEMLNRRIEHQNNKIKRLKEDVKDRLKCISKYKKRIKDI